MITYKTKLNKKVRMRKRIKFKLAKNRQLIKGKLFKKINPNYIKVWILYQKMQLIMLKINIQQLILIIFKITLN